MTVTNTDPIPPDTRSIDDMAFGSGAADQPAVAKTVRDTLRRCGVTVAHEIEELGCTGASAKGLTTTEIAALRVGLGGGGVGLPCFVPPTLYCLAHSTIGGLQVGQASRFPEQVEKISRELSPRERGAVELIEASRRVRGGDLSERLMKTADALSGRDLPTGVEMGNPAAIVEDDSDEPHAFTATPWTCPEHRVPAWSCRYCVAQMVVEGPLEPTFFISPGRVKHAMDLSTDGELVKSTHVDEMLQQLDAKEEKLVSVFAHVATFSRKLARD